MALHRSLLRSLLPVLVILAAAACESVVDPDLVACPHLARSSIVAQVHDDDGMPAAIGTTVSIRNRAGYAASGLGFVDSALVSAGENVGGTFDVTVTRPWHTAAAVRNVKVAEGVCGIVEPGRVSVTLSLLPGAPPVRQVVVPPWGYGFGWGNMPARLPARAVTAPGVSQQIVWAARDTTVIRLEPDGSLTTQCRSTRGSTWAVASSVVDPSVRDSVNVTVWADSDPTRCPST